MNEYKQLILANMAWATERSHDDADFFKRHLVGQKPEFLWIGCSDSRVAPDQITQSTPGELFIHRNIANLVSATDLNLMSVLQYAVDVLGVNHIIVCGHYGCGGIIAALDSVSDDHTGSPIDAWLDVARGVHDDHAAEIDTMPDREAKVNRFVECNVRDQLVRLARTPVVQNAFARGSNLWLHGWVYDLRDGLLKPLLDIDKATDLADVGRPERVLV